MTLQNIDRRAKNANIPDGYPSAFAGPQAGAYGTQDMQDMQESEWAHTYNCDERMINTAHEVVHVQILWGCLRKRGHRVHQTIKEMGNRRND